jgi:hypothetical protein
MREQARQDAAIAAVRKDMAAANHYRRLQAAGEEAARRASTADAQIAITKLVQASRDANAQVMETEAKYRQALERAKRANETAALVSALQFAVSMGKLADMAVQGLGPDTPPQVQAELKRSPTPGRTFKIMFDYTGTINDGVGNAKSLHETAIFERTTTETKLLEEVTKQGAPDDVVQSIIRP